MKNPLPRLPLPDSFDGLYFTTLRLRDALPQHFEQNLGLQFYTQQQESAQYPDRHERLLQARKRLFARYDEVLDAETYGQGVFRETVLARLLIDDLKQSFSPFCTCLAGTILPNHVHLLLQFPTKAPTAVEADEFDVLPFPPLREFVSKFQKHTETHLAKEWGHSSPVIFQKKGADGIFAPEKTMWHERSFDFEVQTAGAFHNIVAYIVQNAQKAGLAEQGHDWPFFWPKQS